MAEWLVGLATDLNEGDRRVIAVNGRELVVFRFRDRLYALDNTCLHQGGPVGEGVLVGRVEAILDDDRTYSGERFSESTTHLVCPWHGWEYDIDTGACAGDQRRRLRRYELVQRENRIYVVA